MALKLSILICTIHTRAIQLQGLVRSLQAQIPHDSTDVEILINEDAGTVGAKRQYLLDQAKGDYIVFIDDDDEVSANYVTLIMQSINNNPECKAIGISGTMTTNGGKLAHWKISQEFTEWFAMHNIYYRCINHISPVRRDIALKVGFKDIVYGEDHDYSMRLREHLEDKPYVDIEQPIYHYKYVSNK